MRMEWKYRREKWVTQVAGNPDCMGLGLQIKGGIGVHKRHRGVQRRDIRYIIDQGIPKFNLSAIR